MSCMSGPCRHGNILHVTLCITRGDGPICLGAVHLTLFSVIGSYLASNFSSVLGYTMVFVRVHIPANAA